MVLDFLMIRQICFVLAGKSNRARINLQKTDQNSFVFSHVCVFILACCYKKKRIKRTIKNKFNLNFGTKGISDCFDSKG